MEILRNIDKNIALKEFDRVLTEFEKSLGLNITLHDYTGMLYHLDEKRLFPNRNYHQCPYCMAGRFQEPGWRLFCVKDCQMISDTQLRKDPEPYLKTCWKGVIELVIPLISQKKVIAAAYVGAFKGEIPERSSIPEKYLKLYEQLPELPPMERSSIFRPGSPSSSRDCCPRSISLWIMNRKSNTGAKSSFRVLFRKTPPAS